MRIGIGIGVPFPRFPVGGGGPPPVRVLTSFRVTVPATATVGTPLSFTVTAVDQFGVVFPSYAGTVHFTSSDGAASLPANSTLTSGTGTFSATFNTTGSQSITAADTVQTTVTGVGSSVVSGAAPVLTSFAVVAPSASTVGVPFNVTVTARDQFGATFSSYAGTVHFTSTDGAAVLPANSTLTAGTRTFSATFNTVGNQNISVNDTVQTSITGTSNPDTVSNPVPATKFLVSAPGTAVAGTPVNVTVTAQDASNNTVPSYAGTVHLTSSDSVAILPADSTLTAGVKTFSVQLNSVGSFTVTATDTVTATINGTSGAVTVSAAATPAFVPALPSNSAKASIYADFTTEGTTNQYWTGAFQPAGFAAWLAAMGGSFSRSSAVPVFQSGLVVQIPANTVAVASNAGGVSQGIHITPPQTELLLWNRDLTNAVWVPTTMTVAKNQTGIDGVANSCSSLTATAANATILQSLTRASSRRCSGVWVKRITGSGAIQMTQDGGTTWTAITVTASFSQFASGINMQTVVNPVIGLRIVTSGDAIAVDYVSHREVLSSIVQDIVPDPIANTSTTNALAGDRIIFPYSVSTFSMLTYTANSVYWGMAAGVFGGDSNANGWALVQSDATHWSLLANSVNLAPTTVVNFQNLIKVMIAGGPANRACCTNNGTVASVAAAISPVAYSNLVVGGAFQNVSTNWTGDIARIAIWTNQIATNADLGALTT
jgi:hypothetical protein